jgi:GntR family transcriptional regulator
MATGKQEPFQNLVSRPLYSRAAGAVMEYVRNNSYEPGDMLPAEDALSQQLHVSRTTLREAMGILEREGLIIRKQGAGTFVARPSQARLLPGLHQLIPLKQLAAASGLVVETLDREFSMVPPSAELAALFNLEPNDRLVRLQIVLGIDGQRISYFDSQAPARILDPDEFASSDASVLEYCLARGYPVLRHSHAGVYAINAEPDVAAHLGLPAGAAVLHLEETYHTDANEPVVHSHNYHVTERFNFRIVRQVVDFPEWLPRDTPSRTPVLTPR